VVAFGLLEAKKSTTKDDDEDEDGDGEKRNFLIVLVVVVVVALGLLEAKNRRRGRMTEFCTVGSEWR
jgi:hypothetical protein